MGLMGAGADELLSLELKAVSHGWKAVFDSFALALNLFTKISKITGGESLFEKWNTTQFYVVLALKQA